MLDPSSAKVVSDWLKNKCPHLKCPACGNKHWQAGDLVADQQQGAPFGALVSLTCANCALTVFFAAAPMGLATPGASDEG
jgi:hypothetical protein